MGMEQLHAIEGIMWQRQRPFYNLSLDRLLWQTERQGYISGLATQGFGRDTGGFVENGRAPWASWVIGDS